MPVYAAIFMVVMLSSVGLPGLNGFVGEFLILLGAFLRTWLAAAVAVSGLVLGALYLFWAYERVMFGPITKAVNGTMPRPERPRDRRDGAAARADVLHGAFSPAAARSDGTVGDMPCSRRVHIAQVRLERIRRSPVARACRRQPEPPNCGDRR